MASNLWTISTSGDATLVGPTGRAGLADLSVDANGRMIAVDVVAAFQMDPLTALATPLPEQGWAGLILPTALDALPGGKLLTGSQLNGDLYEADLVVGGATPISYVAGSHFVGDIAVDPSGDVAVATMSASSTTTNHLISFDLSTGQATDVGPMSVPNVQGLDFGCDGKLYGVTYSTPPLLVRIDPATASATMLGSLSGPSELTGLAGPALPCPQVCN